MRYSVHPSLEFVVLSTIIISVMPRVLSGVQVKKIIALRRTGHSLPEIRRMTGFANATVYKYIQGVTVEGRYIQVLRDKQGGSKKRAALRWCEAQAKAEKLLQPPYTDREMLLLLAAVYWGEGTKRELNIINGDPVLLRLFVVGIKKLGVPGLHLRATVRVYGNADEKARVKFWSRQIGIPVAQFVGIERVPGSQEIKLPHGMCRIRVVKSAEHFKLLMSMIHLLKSEV